MNSTNHYLATNRLPNDLKDKHSANPSINDSQLSNTTNEGKNHRRANIPNISLNVSGWRQRELKKFRGIADPDAMAATTAVNNTYTFQSMEHVTLVTPHVGQPHFLLARLPTHNKKNKHAHNLLSTNDTR